MSDKSDQKYPWEQAALDLALSKSGRLEELLAVARLDPQKGDISHIDLRGIDLTGQDMRKWNMKHARMAGAIVSRADFRGTIIDPRVLASTRGWREAYIDAPLLRKVEICAYRAFLRKAYYRVLLDISVDEQRKGRFAPSPIADEFLLNAKKLRMSNENRRSILSFYGNAKSGKNFLAHFLERRPYLEANDFALVAVMQMKMKEIVEQSYGDLKLSLKSADTIANVIALYLPASEPRPRFLSSYERTRSGSSN